MNNNDYFQIEVNKGDHRAAALLALEFAAGKASRSGCWSWANAAIEQAAEIGIELDPGNLSWPDLNSMTNQLKRSV
jgi:hypothetical protein